MSEGPDSRFTQLLRRGAFSLGVGAALMRDKVENLAERVRQELTPSVRLQRNLRGQFAALVESGIDPDFAEQVLKQHIIEVLRDIRNEKNWGNEIGQRSPEKERREDQ